MDAKSSPNVDALCINVFASVSQERVFESLWHPRTFLHVASKGQLKGLDTKEAEQVSDARGLFLYLHLGTKKQT